MTSLSAKIRNVYGPYCWFKREQVPILIKQYPNYDKKSIGKEVSILWNNMSLVQKRPYIDKCEDDRKRYQDEIKA